MDAKFSQKVKDVITLSRKEALRLGHDSIAIEHLVLGIVREGEGLALKVLRSLSVDPDELKMRICKFSHDADVSQVNIKSHPKC